MGQRLHDAALGLGGQLQAVTADEFEKPEQQRGILQGRKLAQENAASLRGMAQEIEQGGKRLARLSSPSGRLRWGTKGGVEFAYPVDANELFPVLRTADVARLQAVADFYEWQVRPDGTTVARWVTSWDTTEDDIDRFCEALPGSGA